MAFSTERRVEFRDTDAAGIVHFSVFFPMMEAAEHALLRSLGLSVLPEATSEPPRLTWPRVAASCQYTSAAHFEDLLTIEVRVAKIGTTSVQYRFRFTRSEQLIAEGEMTSVCCDLQEGPFSRRQDSGGQDSRRLSRLTKTPIPDSVRELLSRYE